MQPDGSFLSCRILWPSALVGCKDFSFSVRKMGTAIKKNTCVRNSPSSLFDVYACDDDIVEEWRR